MANLPEWLPPLVLLSDCAGDWPQYLAKLYTFFKRDFVESTPSFQGRRIGLKRLPFVQSKEATFWHLISEGSEEDDRLPEMRRCERVRWPRPIIERDPNTEIKVWRNRRHGETRICLWVEDAEYLVVLAERREHILLWTAYPVKEPHRKRKLRKEYEEAVKG